MTTKEKMNSINRTARITGLLYLILFPLGIFGILYVPAILIVPEDAVTTEYPLEETAEALRYLGEGHAKGKIVITVQTDDKS